MVSNAIWKKIDFEKVTSACYHIVIITMRNEQKRSMCYRARNGGAIQGLSKTIS